MSREHASKAGRDAGIGSTLLHRQQFVSGQQMLHDFKSKAVISQVKSTSVNTACSTLAYPRIDPRSLHSIQGVLWLQCIALIAISITLAASSISPLWQATKTDHCIPTVA